MIFQCKHIWVRHSFFFKSIPIGTIQFNFQVGHQKEFVEITGHGTKIQSQSIAQGGKKMVAASSFLKTAEGG